MGTMKKLPSLPHCLPMQTYPHAFLLGLLQKKKKKKCIQTNQRRAQRVVWVPEVIGGSLNDVLGPRFGLWCGRAKESGL